MDITVERILSLLPHNEAGKIKHGAKAELAKSLGFDSGDVVNAWESGKNKSYVKYLYQIATMYGVSIAWLRGDTDDRQPPSTTVSSFDAAVLERVHALPPEQRRAFLLLIGLSEELLDALDREAPKE